MKKTGSEPANRLTAALFAFPGFGGFLYRFLQVTDFIANIANEAKENSATRSCFRYKKEHNQPTKI